jgi:hypothetical protein
MARCRATKANGEPCTLPANGPQGLCWAQDPQNAAKRRTMASHAAKAKGNRRLSELDKQLENLAADALEGNVERGVAAVVNQILNTRARLLELERKIRETDELEQRLEELERALEQNKRGGGIWGA